MIITRNDLQLVPFSTARNREYGKLLPGPDSVTANSGLSPRWSAGGGSETATRWRDDRGLRPLIVSELFDMAASGLVRHVKYDVLVKRLLRDEG